MRKPHRETLKGPKAVETLQQRRPEVRPRSRRRSSRRPREPVVGAQRPRRQGHQAIPRLRRGQGSSLRSILRSTLQGRWSVTSAAVQRRRVPIHDARVATGRSAKSAARLSLGTRSAGSPQLTNAGSATSSRRTRGQKLQTLRRTAPGQGARAREARPMEARERNSPAADGSQALAGKT